MATLATCKKLLKDAGYETYPRDGMRGMAVVDTDGFHVEYDRFGVVNILRVGKTTKGPRGDIVTLDFLPSEVRDEAIAASDEAMPDIVEAVRAAIKVATGR